jgi:hypothetical protein
MKALAGATLTDRGALLDESQRVLRGALDAVTASFENPTPVHVTRFVSDAAFRDRLLLKVENPFLRLFKEQYDEKLRTAEQMSKFSPIINKQDKLMRPALISMLCQTTCLDFLHIMNTRKVIICRLSKGRLGEEIAAILGSFIISMISIYAMRREAQTRRPPFMLVVDEVHNFTYGGRFGSLLAEARKYGISLVTACQGLYQVPFIRDIFSNADNKIVFKCSGEDADTIANDWKEETVKAVNLANLPRYKACIKTYKDTTPVAYYIAPFARIDPRGDEADPQRLIQQSLQRWSKNKKDVQQKIMHFFKSE